METAIARDLLRRILAQAAATPDREICGLLLGRPGAIRDILPADNVSADPATRFELDPAVQFAALRRARGGGAAVVGCYHSHPLGEAVPSARDEDGARDPGQLWLIVAGGTARLWRVIRPGRFAPVPLMVTDAVRVA